MAAAAASAAAGAAPRGLKVLVSGASGMVGRALCAELERPSALNSFHPQVYRLVRRAPENDREIYWQPHEMRVDLKRMEGFDAVVHLAGENVGSGEGFLAFTGRWTQRKKYDILESRRRGTQLLAQAVGALRDKPRVFISASGVGFYGNGGEAELTEASPTGSGFLAEVSRTWEASTAKAAEAGVRVVNLRFGVILSRTGGVIEKLYWPFFLGGGGPIGSGQQWMSYVTLGDAVRAIHHCMARDDVSGPVNVMAPQPVRNAEFVAALGRAMGRPALLPMPEPIVRGLFGEMGDETLLVSQRGVPAKLQASGFRFLQPDIDSAMREALQR